MSDDSNMVRKVAKAIAQSRLQQEPSAPLMCEWEAYAMARAAIEAMREPTPEMLEAAENAGVEVGCPEGNIHVGAWTASQFWLAMFDAALRARTPSQGKED